MTMKHKIAPHLLPWKFCSNSPAFRREDSECQRCKADFQTTLGDKGGAEGRAILKVKGHFQNADSNMNVTCNVACHWSPSVRRAFELNACIQ